MDCPNCGAQVQVHPADLEGETVECTSCGQHLQIVLEAVEGVDLHVEKPAGTDLLIDRHPDDTMTVTIPFGAKRWHMLVAAVWVAIMLAAGFRLFFVADADIQTMGAVFVLIACIAAAVFYVLYATRTTLTISADEFVIRRSTLGLARELRLKAPSIDGLCVAGTSLQAISAGGRHHRIDRGPLQFGFLNERELLWLFHELVTFMRAVGYFGSETSRL